MTVMSRGQTEAARAGSASVNEGERSLLRVVFSRDEQRTRPDAQPPVVVDAGAGRRALMPIDPVSRGTWIAANDAGLLLALLNGNPTGGVSGARSSRSRGEVIPALIGAANVDEVMDLLKLMNLQETGYFRLVAIGQGVVRDMVWDGVTLQIGDPKKTLDKPVMFTSSGLGDAVVQGPRRALFDSMTGDGGWDEHRQDGYHRHRWPDRPEVSVWMERSDAVTVSWTTVEVSPCTIKMWYCPATSEPSERVMRTLALRA